MAAGSIVVDLLLKTGSFETDTARASKALKKMQADADAVGKGIGVALTGAAVGLVYLVKSTIDAEAHLAELSTKTGIAVETLGGIGFAAEQSGSSLDAVAAGVGKLNVSLAKAAEGNQQIGAAFKALGVEVFDPLTGKTITVDKALTQLADTFQKAGDSPEKFRAAQAVLGKQYQELLPLLSRGGEAIKDQIAFFQKYSGVSETTAQQAKQFNETLSDLKLLSGAFGKELTAQLLPPLIALSKLFVEMKENGDQFKGVAGDIVSILKGMATFAAVAAVGFATLGDQLGAALAGFEALKQGRFQDAFNIGKDALSRLKEKIALLEKITEAINNPPTPEITAKPKGPDVPGIPDPAKLAAAEELLQKQLEAALRAIKLTTDQMQGALSFNNKLLEGEYQDGVISLQNFFDNQSNIRKRALQIALAEQDKIIAAEQAFAAKTTNPAKREEADAKVDDARQRKTALIIAAGQAEQLALQQNARDVISLTNAYNDLRSTLASLQGDDFTAEVIKNSQQVAAAVKLISQVGGDPAQANELARQLQLRADLNQATKDFGLTLHDLSNDEERVALLQQQGTLTSLGALIKLGEERKKQIPLLEAEVAAYEAIAKASPDDKSLAQKAEDARLQLDKLKASVDPLAASLNQAFGSDLESALTDFVTGTKSAADAFHSFTNAVLTDILKLGSKSIAESIIGGSGGLGGLLSGLLSSGSGGNVQGIGDKYSGSGSGGLISGLASIFSGFFADGGFIPPGKFGVVGERGPELAFGGSGGQSIGQLPGGTTQHINVMVQGAPSQSRDSAMQQGAAIGLGIQRALARNT
jgi:hypothetical protein